VKRLDMFTGIQLNIVRRLARRSAFVRHAELHPISAPVIQPPRSPAACPLLWGTLRRSVIRFASHRRRRVHERPRGMVAIKLANE